MATDSQAGSSGGFMGFSFLLSFRRNQVASMDTIDTPPNNISSHEHHDGELVDRFQSHVARLLRSLLPSDPDSDSSAGAGAPLLSLPFLSKLLDVLVSCDREFYHLLLLLNPSSSSASSLSSKSAAEFLDRSVRALDLCNAASAALLSLRHWRRQADVAASSAALRRRRALRRALSKLFAAAAAAADSPGGGGRSASARFLSKNWSGGGAAAAAAPGGMAAAACTMSCLLAFAAWALAAAVPFLDRGERPAPPRHMQWAAAMAALQERIAEECSQRRRGGLGVLAEVRAVETHARCLTELLDKEDTAAAEDELSAKGAELAEACRALEAGTEPLERQVRAVFHRVAATRAEFIRCLDRSSHCASAPAPPAASAAAASSSSSSAPSPF